MWFLYISIDFRKNLACGHQNAVILSAVLILQKHLFKTFNLNEFRATARATAPATARATARVKARATARATARR